MSGSAVVGELQGEVELLALEQGDDGLQVVLLLAGDAQLVALDLRLNALRALIADDLGDLLRVVLRDALGDLRRDAVLLAGLLRLASVQCLERDRPLDELLLEDVEHRLAALLALRLDGDVVAGPGDGGADALEVVAGRDLLRRLVQGVVDLLPVDLADDVERRVGHCSLLAIVSRAPGGLPEWSKGADCKSAGSAYEGSNPSPATTCVHSP